MLEVLADGNQFKLTTVGTDFGLEDKFIEQLHQQKGLAEVDKWIFVTPIAESLYFDVDKRWRSELPLTFLVDAQGNSIKHRGLLSKQQLETWLAHVAN